MSSITSFARNISRTTTGKPFFPIIFNPGTPADIGFFGIADNIVEREDVGSEGYDVGEVIDSIPEGERGNSTVIAYDCRFEFSGGMFFLLCWCWFRDISRGRKNFPPEIIPLVLRRCGIEKLTQ